MVGSERGLLVGPVFVGDAQEHRLEAGRAGDEPVQPDVVLLGPAEQCGELGLQVVDVQDRAAAVVADPRTCPGGEGRAGCSEGDLGGVVRDDLRRAARADDLTGPHDREVVGQGLGLLEVVRGEQHRGALVAQSADQPPHLAPALRVETGGGFVEHHHVGAAHQRAGEVDAALLATGQRPHPRAGTVLEVEHGERLLQRPGVGDGGGPHLQGLGDAQVCDEAAPLEKYAGAAAYGGTLLDRVHPEHPHLAGAGRGQPLDHLEGGGLAGAVDAQQRVDRSGSNAQVDPPDGLEGTVSRAVAAAQSAGGDGVFVHASSIRDRSAPA